MATSSPASPRPLPLLGLAWAIKVAIVLLLAFAAASSRLLATDWATNRAAEEVANIERLARTGGCATLRQRWTTEIRWQLREHILNGIAYCADSEALGILAKALMRPDVDGDFLAGLNALEIYLTRIQNPLSDHQITKSLISKIPQVRVRRQIATILNSRLLPLDLANRQQIGGYWREYQEPALLGTVTSEDLAEVDLDIYEHRWALFDRISHETTALTPALLQELSKLVVPGAKHEGPPALSPPEASTLLQYWARVPSAHGPSTNQLLDWAGNHKSPWVRRESLKTWYVRSPATNSKKTQIILALLKDNHSQVDEFTGLEIIARYGGTTAGDNSPEDSYLASRLPVLASLKRVKLLGEIIKRPNLDQRFALEALMIMARGNHSEALAALKLLRASNYDKLADALNYSFRRFRGHSDGPIRKVILQMMASNYHDGFLELFALAARDSQPEVAALGRTLFNKHSKTPMPAAATNNAVANQPDEQPTSDPTILGKVLVITTTSGNMRMRFLGESGRIAAELYEKSFAGQLDQMPFARDSWDLVTINLPELKGLSPHGVPQIVAAKRGHVSIDPADPSRINFQAAWQWGHPQERLILGEIVSGLDVLTRISDGDPIIRVTVERIVSVGNRQQF